MSVSWTREQIQVIENRGSNLLVSAAAGSGKTAVLVERIIRMVTDGEHPLDIDKLLVMTFTNAAAAEMRERIGAAIEKKLEETPDNAHLQAQSALVHHAQITTIDSFCLNLIRSHFNCLDLDPSFRIGDEGELLLLRGDVMKELLEDYYAEGSEAFEQFARMYAPGKSDAGIESYIMQVYTFSQSNPYPQLWLEECRKDLEEGSPHRWITFLMEDVKKQASELAQQEKDALEACREDAYLCAYTPMLTQDIRRLEQIAAAENPEELYAALSHVTWDRLAAVRSKEADADKKAYVTGCRDRVKKAVAKLAERYAFATPEEMFRDMEKVQEPVKLLLELAEEFSRRYQEKKRERNLVDFNDLEHEALKVLIASEDGRPLTAAGGGYVYTDAADELSRQYEEVLVDEYQDSNLVQEALMHAVSRERFGHPNVFMVGDVKQSIYKFRLARPELFLEKYHSYIPADEAGEDGNTGCRKIELHQNFRSRPQVLEGINDIFYRIMTENMGGIQYTEEAALHPGAEFAPMPGEECAQLPGDEYEPLPDGECTPLSDEECALPSDGEEDVRAESRTKQATGLELVMVDTGTAALSQLDDEAADYTAKEIEAKLIAGKIRELTDPEHGLLVWDKKKDGTGGYRIARYQDIVVLLRSTAGWSETLTAVLMNEGIPAYAESRTGYFTTIEVETVLSLLAVIDNPMQDIPLAAVLKSPVVGMSDQELAEMMADYKASADKGQDRGIYAAMHAACRKENQEGSGEDCREERREAGQAGGENCRGQRSFAGKLAQFLDRLAGFRRESTYLPIHELIYRVYEQTGYYDYVSAMPAGETRRANLDMLVEQAAAYEKTSYKGLFHFIRYIENLKKYNTDFGEASTVGEEDNTVRIMSIHKSKGLEFPIVFLAGMGKKFNRQDTYGKLLIDPELGIAVDYMDPDYRLKATTLKKNVLRRKLELENMGEELRVLYVAMTRAKEKLVMTGTDRYLEKNLEKYMQVPVVDGQIPYTILSGAGSYLDWVLMSCGAGAKIRTVQVPVAELVGEELVRQIENRRSRNLLLELDMDEVYEAEYRDMLERHLQYQYPYEADIRLHTKMSVSELKKQGQMTDEAESVRQPGPLDLAADQERPAAHRQQRRKTMAVFDTPPDSGYGATRGTAYHRALELLDFACMESREDVEQYLDMLVEQNRYSKENRKMVDAGVIWAFFQSPLGKRMRAASQEKRLKKERQFVMGVPAREMGAGDTDELVVIQGIIDAYFEEDGELVLVDYKTDNVNTPQILVDHYKKQLDYYERALFQMTGKTVREKVIYSLTLQREILC